MVVFLVTGLAAGQATNLDELVDLAVARDPQVAALGYDASAAEDRAVAALRPMDPQLMLSAQALGAPMTAPDPTMFMVGVSQMLRGPGEAAAVRRRLRLEVDRAQADQDRVRADLKLELWQAAARLQALTAERALLDEQIEAAIALREIGLRRYGAGRAPAGAGGAMNGAMPEEPPATAPPAVPRPGMPATGGMPGMGGGMAPAPGMPPMAPGPMPDMGGAGGGMAMPSGPGMGSLLRLDAEVARVQSELAAIDARIEGEVQVLALYVGDEATEQVLAAPAAYVGVAGDRGELAAPETALADIASQAAAADLRVARRARLPDLMVSAARRIMPGEMVDSTDLGVGIALPLWGRYGREIDAARASVEAAEAREAGVVRDVELARARAAAAWEAAMARLQALEEVAVPRARSSWRVSVAELGAGTLETDEAVLVWQSALAIERDAISARLNAALRAAELARLEEP